MGQKNILIADDEQEFCSMAANFFEERGYKASCVNKGEDAIKKVKEEKFDIVLLDLRMPYFSGGFGIFREIKQVDPNIPIILITGCTPAEIQKPLEDINADDVLYKPFKMDKLLKSIEKILVK